MSLDGLRAWIGEVERKLGMRTRVFLALTVIAIGLGAAGIYLAVDARDSSVSESDVQALQEQLEARIGEGGATTNGTDTATLEAELKALKAEVEQLGGESESTEKGKGGSAGATGGEGGSEGASGSEGAGAERNGTNKGGAENPGGATSGTDAGSPKLKELLERAKAKSEANE
jgi:hypothetical protein